MSSIIPIKTVFLLHVTILLCDWFSKSSDADDQVVIVIVTSWEEKQQVDTYVVVLFVYIESVAL
jgi:hypothetical protein